MVKLAIARLFLMVAFLMAAQFAWAQSQLVLQNPSKFKRDQIQVGDLIGIELRGQESMYFGQVEKVKADWIYIFGDSIKADSIVKIHVEKPHFWPGLVRGAAVSGMVFYPLMIAINTPKNAWSFKNQGFKIGGILVGGYLLQRFMKIFYWRRVNLEKGKWELKIMPTADALF